MADAPRDGNRVPTLQGVSSVDGRTSTDVYTDPLTNRLYVDASISADASQATGINGAPVTVGTTAVEMTFTGTTKTIAIKSASTNTGLIWFGPATVTNAGANAYGELTTDSAIEIELNDAAAPIYAISDTATQKVYKAALT